MREMLESFTETIKERFKSPFFGTFIIAWIVVNWRIILFLALSNDPIAVRIDIAETMYLSPENYFLIPFSLTMLYLIVPGYIMQLVEEINVEAIKTRREVSAKILKHEYEIKEKQAGWDNDLEDIKASSRDKKVLNDKIELLTIQVSERDNHIESLKKELQNLSRSYNDTNLAIAKINSQRSYYAMKIKFNGLPRPPEVDIISLTKERFGSQIFIYGITGGEDAFEGSINFKINNDKIHPTEFSDFIIKKFGYEVLEITGKLA